MIDFLPGEQENTAFKIFHRPWCIKVSAIHLVSEDYIRHIGVPTSGDKKRDSWMRSEVKECYFTIDNMAHLHERGANILFVNPDDVIEIYSLIQEHLATWLEILQKKILLNHPDMTDFEMLDSLAAALYPLTLHKGQPLTSMEALFVYLQGGNRAFYNDIKKRARDEKGNEMDMTITGHRSYIPALVTRLGYQVTTPRG